MAKDWYAPREIYFNQSQMLWLIQHLPELREGIYPRDYSSYIDTQLGRRSANIKAPFQTAAEFVVDVEMRLERAGIDGIILEGMEGWGKSAASFAAHLGIPEYLVKKKRDTALRYVSGWRKKPRAYKQFYDHKKAISS